MITTKDILMIKNKSIVAKFSPHDDIITSLKKSNKLMGASSLDG
jgi:hypothetical protein